MYNSLIERTHADAPAEAAPAQGESARQPLTRRTVNLIPRAKAALELAVQQTGDSPTATINRALQAYAFLVETASQGDEILIRRVGSGNVERIIFA